MLAVRKPLLTPAPFPFSMEKCGLYLPLWQEDMQGSTIISHDPNHHSCTVSGAVWRPDGRSFVSANEDIILCGNNAVLAPVSATFQIWVYPTSFPSQVGHDLFCKSYAGATNSYSVSINTSSKITFVLSTDGIDNVLTVTSSASVATDAWSFIEITHTSGAQRIYVNKVQDVNTGNTAGDIFAGTCVLGIGNQPVVFGTGVQGYIGEAWIYSEVRSAAERAHNYDVTKWRYQ